MLVTLCLIVSLSTYTTSSSALTCDATNLEACTEFETTDGASNGYKYLTLSEIDISLYQNGDEHEKKLIAAEVNEQLHKIGMFAIKNHGLSSSIINQLFLESKSFFDETKEYKSKYGTNGVLGANGFEPVGSINVGATYNSSIQSDPVESFVLWYIKMLNPSEINKYCPYSLYQSIIKYYSELVKILHILHEIFVLALGLETNQFDLDIKAVSDINNDNEYFLEFRMQNYVELELNEDDKLSSELRFADHADWGTVTFLRLREEDIDNGLQIKLERVDDEWYNIDTKALIKEKDTLIVNLGEVFEMYTSGYWLAPRHRVVSLTTKRRMSIVVFFGPYVDQYIDELVDCKICKENRNDTIMDKYSLPTKFRDHARMRFVGSFEHDDSVKLPFFL